jgi:large subunit ribosomal protein L31
MKKDIHPQYQDITFTCACGAKFVAGSTIKEDYKTEICSNCHPFYTGKQKLIDASGRVDKFMAKVKKANAIKETKATKKTKKSSKTIKITTEEKEATEE